MRGDEQMAQNELDIEFMNTTDLIKALHERIRDGHRFACWFDAGRGCWIMRVNNLDAHKIAHFEAFKHNAEPDPKPIE